MSAFVDSSVWFAAAATRDAQNERAKSILQSIDQYLTTDLVLVETCQLLKARFGRGVAEVLFALPMSPGSSKITRVRCSDVSIRCTWTRA
ncbi:type II toxin-antitoxin system VapC family toxin [Bradyrhizobium sp. 38]|nr:type II toxin-antitoxin system VapC family toxin [Bradyrhizobium sp. 38]MCK1779781.1 type II toxin-antitoxin system VapC family toxin [Bradyrhizobium sp. 132]